MLLQLLASISSNMLYLMLHIEGAGSFPKPLKPKEEREALARYRAGDMEARNLLIEHNLRLVAHIIKKYYSSYADQDDLISIGTIGLIKGIGVYPSDGVMARAVYYAAIDKFSKAKQVDESCTEEANQLISSYSAHLPSNEEVFMHPDLEKGKAVTIGGWIGESTIVR